MEEPVNYSPVCYVGDLFAGIAWMRQLVYACNVRVAEELLFRAQGSINSVYGGV